jgi:hypothetical protein
VNETHTPRWPRRWPVAVISLPAAVATWSGWVGLGEMTGFGKVKLLPGIWDSLQINTAVTLPVGVEAYAAYALSAALTSAPVTGPTRRFAWISSVCALALGMGAQIAYHLLRNANRAEAPWQITTFVSCLPVLVLGLGAVLAHMLHRDRTAAAAEAAPVVAEVVELVVDDAPDEQVPGSVLSRPQTVATEAVEVAEPVAEEATGTSLVEAILGQPLPLPAETPDPGQGAVVSLDDAVISARAAGMSVRAVSEAFNVTRYRVEKLDKQREAAAVAVREWVDSIEPADTVTEPATVNGYAFHTDH